MAASLKEALYKGLDFNGFFYCKIKYHPSKEELKNYRIRKCKEHLNSLLERFDNFKDYAEDRLFEIKSNRQYKHDLKVLKSELKNPANSYNKELDHWFLVQEDLEK